MTDQINTCINNITNAITVCQKRRLTDVPSAGNILKNKVQFLEAIKEDIVILNDVYAKGSDKELIYSNLEKIAREIIDCGHLYFKQKPNATSFLEDNFMADVENLMTGYSKSQAIENMLGSAHDSWHWHGW